MEQGEKLLLALPGVPVEMRSMFERTVLPLLQERWSGEPVVDRILKTTGAPESSIAERIGPLLEARDRRVRVAFLPNRAGVTLRLVFRGENRSEGQRLVGELEDAIRRELGYLVYGSGTETMEQILGYLLVLREATISVAESCTGGLIGDRITNVPGSSSYFRGGVVAYSDEIKEHVLGVPAEILEAHGAVSAQTATAMVAGVRRLMGSDLGLAVTGIAGPTGGTPEKPVGLVYVALARETGTLSEERRFSGGREEIKYRTSQWALDLVRRFLIGGIP
jgi:nicotinamide-nucleotide amidase